MPDRNPPHSSLMVVEDEVIIAIDLVQRLEKLGYSVCATLSSGEEAVKSVQRFNPDLILMDIALEGGMDGIQAAEAIRSSLDIPVVFMTACADVDRLNRAKEILPYRYILKPFQDRDLKTVIEMSLYSSRIDRERRKAEQALQKANQQLHATIKALPDLFFEIDRQGRILNYNAPQPELLNIIPEQVFGRKIDDIFPGEPSEAIMKAVDRASKDGFHYGDVYCHTIAGKKYWFELSVALRDDPEDNRDCFVVLARDITDRKKTEDSLRAKEKKYQELYKMMHMMADNVPDLIWAKDESDRFLFVNQAMCDTLLKCDHPREAIGFTDMFFAEREKRAGHRHTFTEICINSDEVVKSAQKPGRFLEEGLVRNEYLVLDVHKAPFFNENGVMIGTVGAGRDVTLDKKTEKALKDSEERFRSIVETSPDGIVIQDAEANIIFCNPGFTSILGYTCREAMDMGIKKIHPEDQDSIIEAADRRRMNGETDSYEVEVLHKDGRRIPILVSGAPRYKGGIMIGTVAIFKDISDIKRVESQLNASVKEKEVLLREIHHRVKNNMQVISSLLNLQADKEKENRVAEVLRESQNRVLAMALVHEYLYQSDSMSQIDISEYVRGLVNSINQSYHFGRAPHIDISFPDGIKIGPDQAIPFGLALNELVSNAIKHAFPQERTGKVTITGSGSDGGLLTVSVKDDGIGISEDFNWLESNTLGLFLVKSLIESQLHGSIELNRTLGTEFILRFSQKTVK